MTRFWTLALAAALLGLPACNSGPDTDAGTGGTDTAAAPTGGDAEAGDSATAPAPATKPDPETKPEPPPAPAKPLPGGADPQEVATKLKAAADANDFGAAMALIDPTERTGMVALFGLLPGMMSEMKPMISMMAQMGVQAAQQMPEGEDRDKALAEAKAKAEEMIQGIDAVITEMQAACDKHGVKLPSAKELGISLQGPQPDPAMLAKKCGDKLVGVDHGAFLNDVIKAFDKLAQVMPQGGGDSPFTRLKGRIGDGVLTDVKIAGAKALANLAGQPATFVLVDGRWYLQSERSGAAKAEAREAPGGEEDEEGEEDEDEGDDDDGGK